MSLIVLIAVDDSPWAQKAFEFYVKEIHKEGNEVIIAHVLEPTFHPASALKVGLAIPPEQYEAMVCQSVQLEEKLKKKFCEPLNDKKIANRYICKEGKDVGHTITQLVNDEKAGLCVIGTRGMGKLRRTILGSISNYILHHVHVPVLVGDHEKK